MPLTDSKGDNEPMLLARARMFFRKGDGSEPGSGPVPAADPSVGLASAVTVEGKALPVKSAPAFCKEKARNLVHKYAAFGTAWALLPIPMATSAGLTALETHMIYWIARVYGEEPSRSDVLMTAAGLELCSVALKTVAVEGAMLIPVVGWGVKASIAGGAIEAIGNAIIQHYEQKYPGRVA